MSEQEKKLRIAMLGTKGIPAKWGGIERYVKEIGKRLAQRGHEITIFASKWYCSDYPGNDYEGMRIVRVSSIHLLSTGCIK
jgi:glycosyltransferase involved in cell wall biosynthesis